MIHNVIKFYLAIRRLYLALAGRLIRIRHQRTVNVIKRVQKNNYFGDVNQRGCWQTLEDRSSGGSSSSSSSAVCADCEPPQQQLSIIHLQRCRRRVVRSVL